ncbi:3-methyl-2-oxobutanoate hydroxymethyltransferase [Flavobacterium sp. 9AF]|uniref:nuclear transport factor 2 family protein n=1 Tax=Flavobacterium sp. 9AF TaxID=2653142 RepID=UPI0012EEF91E|nr:nuclear transport factor 2 family protein [Flavobacterium sp. 9AF]VXB55106.1 3-methyl-2-oxobutanoate hydroxymethyltransferase [Flavobacterium sp. 9AF]
MKKYVLYIFILSSSILWAQEVSPKNTIIDFFNAFHRKDSVGLQKVCHEKIIMQTIGSKKEGDKLITEKYADFIKSICNIPNTMKFEERILEYQVKIDGELAHVWTPYEFYINNVLSHKGVNSFTLLNQNKAWVIIHVIDTRNKD